MKQFTEKLEDGRNILSRGFRGKVDFGFMTYVEGESIEKLSRYEDLEEKTGMTFEECVEELEQYRAIGTVEECRNAVEKTKPMALDGYDYDHYTDGTIARFKTYCPSCGTMFIDGTPQWRSKFCRNCGQKILWEVREHEKEEHNTTAKD